MPDDAERRGWDAPYVEPGCPCATCRWATDVDDFFADMDRGARRMVAPAACGCVVCARDGEQPALYARARSYCPDAAWEPRDAT